MVKIFRLHRYGPQSAVGLGAIPLLLFRLGTLGLGLYIGVAEAPVLKEGFHDVFQRSTPVKEEFYQSPYSIEAFVDKKEGFLVPSYGTPDKKIEIGTDMMPLDMYTPQMQRSMANTTARYLPKTLDLLIENVKNEMAHGLLPKETGQALYDQLESFKQKLNTVEGYR